MNRTYIFKFKIGKMENKTGIKIGIAEKNAVEDRENSYKLENMITYLNSIHENEDGFKMTRGVIRNVSHSKRTQFFEEGDIIAVRLKRNLGAVTFILNEDF